MTLSRRALRKVLLEFNCAIGVVLETRLKGQQYDKVTRVLAISWSVESNVDLDKNCRILVLWDSSRVQLVVLTRQIS